jgi:hypothetical protein
VRTSVEVQTYVPEAEAGEWDEAFGRFSELIDAPLEGAVS